MIQRNTGDDAQFEGAGRREWLFCALIHHRVVRHRPFILGIVHHQIDKDRQQATQQRHPVPHLVAVDIAVPSRAAVHQLISQDVEPIEQDRQYPDGVELAQCMIDSGPATLELVLPVVVT